MIEKYESEQGGIWEQLSLPGTPFFASLKSIREVRDAIFASSCKTPTNPYPTTVYGYFTIEEKRRKREQHQPEIMAAFDFQIRVVRGASGHFRGRGRKSQEEDEKTREGMGRIPL